MLNAEKERRGKVLLEDTCRARTLLIRPGEADMMLGRVVKEVSKKQMSLKKRNVVAQGVLSFVPEVLLLRKRKPQRN